MVKASGQYVVERNRVTSVDEGAAPATPTSTGKKSGVKAKKAEEASTPDTKKEDDPATPAAEEVELKFEEPVTPKSADAGATNGDKGEQATPSTTPKNPTSAAPKKRARAKKDTNAEGEDAPKPAAKKARKTKREKAAEGVEEDADEDQVNGVAREIAANDECDDA